MEARELRIGNLITDRYYGTFKTVIVVDSINEKGVNLIASDDNKPYGMHNALIEVQYDFVSECNSLEGIPLTEEWLLNFGFHEKYKSSSNRWYKRAESLNAGCELHDCEDEDTGKLKGVFLHDFSIEIRYVHQLQNLYFALTQEELKCRSNTSNPDEKP